MMLPLISSRLPQVWHSQQLLVLVSHASTIIDALQTLQRIDIFYLASISFFHTLHAGQRFSILSPNVFANTFPQLSHVLKLSSVFILFPYF